MAKQEFYETTSEQYEDVGQKRTPTSGSEEEGPFTLVVGTTQLYENGQVRFIPMPTPDPKDPLNLPDWRKWTAITAVCFFGALALAAEIIVALLIPVFIVEYAGMNPKMLDGMSFASLAPPGKPFNPMEILAHLGGPPLYKTSFLASLPLLTNGISSYFLVPLSIAIGRRPVLLFCGVMAWGGGLWAGFSTSLDSHIAGRCIQGLGAGAVEALIPLIVQDLVFIHQRNRAMASIWSTQGLIIIALGIGSPTIVATIGWRYIYYLSSGAAFIAWIILFILLPESRWTRSPEELAGSSIYPLPPGENRPRINTVSYKPRTLWTDLGIFTNGFEAKEAWQSVIDTIRTMVFPNMLWVIAVNSLFISIQGAAGQTGASVLMAMDWTFRSMGLAIVPVVIATPCVWLLGGYLADKVSNAHSRRHGGRREPEAHLLNLIAPMIFGVVGCIMFGFAGQYIKTHWMVLLTGIFFIALSFLTANTTLSVYIVEAYPQWAGPVLVNVSSWRCIVGFAMSFRATTWVEEMGYLLSFSIYAIAMGVLMIPLPFIYIYGKRLRAWTAGSVSQTVNHHDDVVVEKPNAAFH